MACPGCLRWNTLRSALAALRSLPAASCLLSFKKGFAPLARGVADPSCATALRSPGLSAEDNPGQTGRFVEGMFTSDVVTYGKPKRSLCVAKVSKPPCLTAGNAEGHLYFRDFLFPGPAVPLDSIQK